MQIKLSIMQIWLKNVGLSWNKSKQTLSKYYKIDTNLFMLAINKENI